MSALPSGSCTLVWDSETEARTKPHGRRASRSCRNPWEGNFSQSWSQEVAWSRDNPLCLFINRPWCQASCKSRKQKHVNVSNSFQSVFPFDPVLKTWFGKIANAPGQLNRWATTTGSECPRAWDLHQEKHRTEKPVHWNYRVAPTCCKYRSPEQQWRPRAANCFFKFSQRNQWSLRGSRTWKRMKPVLVWFHTCHGEGSCSLFPQGTWDISCALNVC